jgi:hypothetical protein
MLKRLAVLGAVTLLGTLCAPTPVYAWKVIGNVYCDANQNGQIDAGDTPLANIRLNVASADGTFTALGITDTAGDLKLERPLHTKQRREPVR